MLDPWIKSNDPQKALSEIEELNTLLISLSETLFEAKIADTGYLEASLAKFTFNASSLILLSRGTPFKDDKTVDISSIYILTRSLIENYLTIFYLYLDHITKSEKEFRFLLYKLSGLCNRQKYLTTSIDGRKKIADEAKEIEVIRDQIRKLPMYVKYVKRIESPSPAPKTQSWLELIRDSPLHTSKFQTLWRLFSNYAHSEYISIIQTQEHYSNQITYRHTLVSSYTILQVTGLLINQFSTLYPTVNMKYNMLSTSKRSKADLWAGIAGVN